MLLREDVCYLGRMCVTEGGMCVTDGGMCVTEGGMCGTEGRCVLLREDVCY